MFSQRTQWATGPNKISQLHRELRQNADHIDLTISNLTKTGLAPIQVNLPTIETYHPEPFGLPKAREAIALYYKERDIEVDASQIFVVPSTSAAYSYLFRLLCNGGDIVLTPRPSYPLFQYLTELSDLKSMEYIEEFDGSWFNPEQALPEHAKAIIQVCPNNPTGHISSPRFRSQIQALGIPVISDEVFADYTSNFSETTWINTPEQPSISLSGLSKVAGLPQHKLAWGVVSGPPRFRKEALQRLEVILDTYLDVSSAIQEALPSILGQANDWQITVRARIEENRRWLQNHLKGTALTLLPSSGGWYAIVQLPRIYDDEKWASLLAQEAKLIVQPGYFYDLEQDSCVVISLILQNHHLQTGIERLISAQQCSTG
ncbi:MAG: pyridoxal phosphate-dependent aminotransferase [Myxococcota bacterium]|nr:pyridoxal phosphate-dependent aminotransferase [Myxococcota bacterium]